MIVIQAVRVEWTKRSRGMPRAARRNAVPEAWSVQGAGDCAVLLQEVQFSEHDGFRTPYIRAVKDPDTEVLHAYGLELARTTGGVAVYFRGDPWRPQYPGPRKVFTLQDGEWARLVSNGRTSYEDTWAYATHVFNIGITSADPETCFTAGIQRPGYADEVQLW